MHKLNVKRVRGRGKRINQSFYFEGCATRVLEASSGEIASPGFPARPTEDGVCVWTISVDPRYKIDLALDTINLGTQSDPQLPCDDSWAVTKVKIYDSITTEKSMLRRTEGLDRFTFPLNPRVPPPYCTRNSSATIQTTGNHLTIVYNVTGAQNANWDPDLEYGFHATYQTSNITGPSEKQTGPLPYGQYTSDNELPKSTRTGECIPLFDPPRLPGIYVGDGFARGFRQACPCSPGQASKTGPVGVFVKNYTTCSNEQETEIVKKVCEDAKKEIREYTNITDFSVRVMDGRATFQAAIISNISTTYALLYYKVGDMNWRTDSDNAPDIDIGTGTVFNGTTVQQMMPYSNTVEALELDNFKGNTDAPNAGSALAFNPSYPSYAVNYTREDEEAYSTCCLKSSSSESCDKYYELRPIGQCGPSLPFRFAWLCCDPHILTLDGRDYLLNDWGEHTLITLKTADVTFTLQSRTGLAETGSGDLTNATVFTAFGAEENGVRVFAGLDPSDNTSLIVYANGTDYSVHFNNNTSFVKDTDQFKLVRDNNSLIISFPSGLGLATSVRMKSLAVSVNVPLAFKGQTRGLLGDYNGNKEDDFILPNGTVLSNNLTERQIFEQFGKAWRVTEANTVMHYGRREGPADYAHPEFTPIFLDEVPLSVRQAAEDVCGSSTNLACIYDYVATKSASIAMDKNTVPQLQGLPSRLSVTSGVVTTFSLEGRDADSDAVLTYHAVDDGNGMVQVDSTSGHVTYTPDSSQPVSLSFYTVDSHNAQSPVRVVPVVICSGCSGHGTCDFSLYSSAENGDYNFQYASCVCDPAWDGPHCERDRDGCLGNPCLQEQTCTDLTPAQQGQNQIGYDCGGCPAGYILDTSSQECVDTDECANSQTNECDMNCFNTLGSYLCTCDAGYRLDNDGHTCWDINECQEQTDRCEHFCNNTAGSYTCMCEEGYTLGESGTTCTQDAATVSLCSNAGCSHGCKSSLDSSTGQRVPECICPDGYDLDPTDEKTCRDHDECQDNLCTQRCFNYNGGFACYCNRGYKLSDDKVTCERCPPLHYGINCELTCTCSGRFKACDPVKGCICEDGWTGSLCQEDVDECSNKTICSSDQICVNTIGSYECTCQDGYRKDSTGMCQDINECVDWSSFSGCGELEICVNLPGEFYCKCLPGYRLVDDQCTDVDECASSENGCEQICDNVQGTYNCDCYYGYRLDTDRTSCTKVSDVCAEVEGLTCDHGCTLSDVDDRAACFCRTGYELGNDQQTCQDIDECSAGTSGCSHTCSNTDGGFLCSCPLGRKLDNDGKTCLECPIGTYGADCSEMCACGRGSERCDVITGCVCKPEWQGERCTDDVNECDRANVQQECRDKNAQCVNYPGGHSCQCGDGYEENENGLCQDIDECLSIVCDQRCENSPGSYRCLCNKGFTLDSQSGLCEGTASCSRTDCPTQNGGCSDEQCFCNRGYNLTATNTCELEDVDWCAEGLCDQDCQETTNGESFTCSCRPGYLLQEDDRSCFECPPGKYGEGCSNTCTCNMQTTVTCHTETGACTCRAGWQGSACGDDIDECATALSVGCPQNSDCENTIGSYRCICHGGYLKDSTGNCTRLRHVKATFTITGISVTSDEISDVNSPSFSLWARSVSQELDRLLRPKVKGFRSVDILALRVGSLIVETDVVLDETSHPDATQTLSVALLDLMGDSLTVNNQTGTVQVAINDAPAEDYTLIIILGISIPLVIIVLGVIIVIVLKKSKKAMKRGRYILRHQRKPEGSDIWTTSQAANSGSENTDSPYATTHELSEHPYESPKTS
ncbi:hypothetical protein BaRGS_00030078, partial [Batillaria attramentaria]